MIRDDDRGHGWEKPLSFNKEVKMFNKEVKMSRFDYVKYDERAMGQQNRFKKDFENLHLAVDELLNGRAKSLVSTKLEEAYMWIGNAIRDEQIARNGSAELQEEV